MLKLDFENFKAAVADRVHEHICKKSLGKSKIAFLVSIWGGTEQVGARFFGVFSEKLRPNFGKSRKIVTITFQMKQHQNIRKSSLGPVTVSKGI